MKLLNFATETPSLRLQRANVNPIPKLFALFPFPDCRPRCRKCGKDLTQRRRRASYELNRSND